MSELYTKYRPKKLEDVVGQPKAVSLLTRFIDKGNLPRQLLFTGGSGCGKTTLARILKRLLKCSNRDFVEFNCADFRGIDMVREIRRVASLKAIGGTTRIWLIDEAHKMTGDAQNAILKILEEPPEGVYIFLATTDPFKLISTIRTRVTEVRCEPVGYDDMTSLIRRVVKAEGEKLSKDVIHKIVESADNSPRKALVVLQSVLGAGSEDDQLQAILSADSQNQAIMIARALINPRTTWSEMQKILSSVDDDPEGIRRLILGYASSVMLGKNAAIHSRAYLLAVAFSDNFYDTGKPGLVTSCFEVVSKNQRR